MQLFHRPSTPRRVERLIREGVGVREASWPMQPDADAARVEYLAESIVAWVRCSMGDMRRPYGVDHVALALACRDESGSIVATSSLGVLRPMNFYEEGPSAEVRGFLDDAMGSAGDPPAEVLAALLSLGDIAFELQGGRAAA